MERGGRFHRYRRHAKQPSTSAGASSAEQANSVLPSTLNPSHANGGNSATAEATQKQQQPGLCIVREQDQYMPIANVIRIMRRILPPHAKISDDAKETIQECVSEYISFITGEANDRCQREQRKTITAEDVLWAMGKLGFDEYVEPLSLFLSKYRESENERNSSARDPILRRSGVTIADYGNFSMPPFVAGFHMGQQVPGMGMGFFDPSMYGGYYRNAFDGAGGSGSGGAGGSSGGGTGSSSYSSNPQINYDPFAQYK